MAVKVYKECVVESCARSCEGRHCGGGFCSREYWVCLAKCTAEHGAPEASSNIGSWFLAGLIQQGWPAMTGGEVVRLCLSDPCDDYVDAPCNACL